MKRFLATAFMYLALAGCQTSDEYQPRNGDLVFQTSLSRQSKAIQLATDSPYSHMGIVYVENGRAMVFEAVGPVKTTPLEDWVASGKEGRYVVKRLKQANEILTPETLQRMKRIGETRFKNLPYDKYFGWSNDRIYCSELVWKIYQEGTGLEIGVLQKLGDFDLSHPEVQKLLKERYGDLIPLDETVISPAAMSASDLLDIEYEN